MDPQPNYIKSLQILFKALFIGQLLFALMVILLGLRGVAGSSVGVPTNIFFYFTLGVSIVAIGMSYKLFNQRIDQAKQQESLTGTLEGYRAVFILQLGLSEGPALLSIIGYFLTGYNLVLILLAILTGNFITLYTTKSKVVRQLGLGSTEESLFG
jgi:hypothetical protein